MNGVASKLKQSLTCSYCSKIYKNPIELPCEDCICREHLKDKKVLDKNKIQCVKCKQEFEVNESDFKSSKFIQRQVEGQVYLSDEEISLKEKIEESIKYFFKMYDGFKLSKTKLDLDSHNHFQEVRRKIDEHREKLKEKIDEIYMEMIEQTKEFEASYLKSLNEKLEASLKLYEKKTVNDELNDLDETFRNPNLSIKTIQEMQYNEEKAIDRIQSKLYEMSQIKDNLIVSNEFKPNLTFDKDSFGQLYLNQYKNDDPFMSHILSGQQPSELIRLCKFSPKDKFSLLYRASQDGFGSNHFHSKCDGHANTLTIFKASGSSFIFGAFTTAKWESFSYNQYKSDPYAFVFSLTNKQRKPCKINIEANKYHYAILCNSGYGPIFGGNNGTDICICSNANTKADSYSNLGYAFKHPQYAYGTEEAYSFLAGSYYFQLSEIEVYIKE